MIRIAQYILILICLSGAMAAQGQLYGNEWVRYNQTYYKIKVGAAGIYRISTATLTAAGMPTSTIGTQLQLFHEGVEVPLLVSTTGVMGANDYIEFYGEVASGLPDTALFEQASWQANTRRSLFSDTGVYFLTLNTVGANKRYLSTPNVISNPPPPLNYCYATYEQYFKNDFFQGKIQAGTQPIYFSTFDNGEGFADGIRHLTQPFSLSVPTPHVVPGQNAWLSTAVLRTTYNANTEHIMVGINNQQIADSIIARNAVKHFSISVPSSLLSSNNSIQFSATYTGVSPYDSYGCNFVSLQYPRDFNVSGLNYFSFQLPAAGQNQYLEFQNFNHNNNAPILYDRTNQKWYVGDIAVSGLTRFYIDPSLATRELVLVANGSSQSYTVTAMQPIQFTDYSQATQQGNYVIVTQKNYQQLVNGKNNVTEYKTYRESIAGGSYKVIVANVDDLYNQFAYGVESHPLAIRRFMQYAYSNWSAYRPQQLFLIGKGVYYNANPLYYTQPASYAFVGNLPTYGYPGSDINYVNFLPDKMQAINVGRLSAWTASEVGNYLDKVKAYEQAIQTPAMPTYTSEMWKKRVLHAAGGLDAIESAGFMQTLTNSGTLIKDTSYGASIANVLKTTTGAIDQTVSASIDSMINEGLSIITYHGHGSATAMQLNTLNTPEKYTNAPKCSHFIGLGCDISQIYTLSPLKTISEKYLYSNTGGSVSIIASDNLQYANFHQVYLPKIYTSISKTNYGKTFGDHTTFAYNSIRSIDKSDFTFFHLESMILQGDPALKLYSPSAPDYFLTSNSIFTTPANVTTNLDSFSFKVVAYNLAKATNDTVDVKIEHTNPANVTSTVGVVRLVKLHSTDTFVIKLGVDKLADLGLNKYRFTIDPTNDWNEVNELNNVTNVEVFIYSDNLIPIYPQAFSIINQQAITLKASTLNPFRKAGKYRIEIDTTEQFNSSLKQQTTITSLGGVIRWTPTLTYNDSTVYYWRTAFDSALNGDYKWSYSSFIYLANGSPGWNQSHYYQYQKDDFTTLNYASNRQFSYPVNNRLLEVYNAVYSQLQNTTPWDNSVFCKTIYSGNDIQLVGCAPWKGTIQISVFDSATGDAWNNSGSSYGSYAVCATVNNKKVFEFPVNTITGRNNAKRLLDSIPTNSYVLIKNLINDLDYDTALVDEWKLDETINGVGQSLYHTIYNMGFTLIDSFNRPRPFIFFRRKGDNSYPVSQYMGAYADTLIRHFLIPSKTKEGILSSTIIGPAKEWQTLKWKQSAIDGQLHNDISRVNVFGITPNNNSALLYSGFAQDTSLSFVDAAQYPYLQLQWRSEDSVNRSCPQLDYWRVLYSPAPEAALNPSAHFTFKDSLQAGQMQHFEVAIESLTPVPMDSLLVRYKVIDAQNVVHTVKSVRYRKLPGNDTLIASITFDPSTFQGNNVFFVEANPDEDQVEQYHPNNLGYIPFRVVADKKNPLVDVTFDGVHILNKDIVSAKPFIKIALRDENQYQLLDDTALLQLAIRYPSDGINESRTIPFDGQLCRFIPAQGNKNEAIIEYRPIFAEDGIYELMVNGKDKSGNVAGHKEYKISFEVINQSTITHVLNYPNPFSTSTAFVFTLTGSQVPTQFKIQIMTVTGKVVKEITRQELGEIHIGRNITDYKWDGKDQYGQTLGNGVYFYRVITSMNGETIEHQSNGTDKFFKNGYGKMYIMR